MYAKVKVRDDRDGFSQPSDDSKSLSKEGSCSPVAEHKGSSSPSKIKVPVCYVPIGIVPMISDSKGGTKKKVTKVVEHEKQNIRASPILRPRAVLSSPENDEVIKKSLKADEASTLKNVNKIQNRHAQTEDKVIPCHTIIISESTRKNSKESAAAAAIATTGEKKYDSKGKQKPEFIF